MLPAETESSGLMTLASRHSLAQTAARLEALLEQHGLRLFAKIDHAAAAARVGLAMPPTLVLIFGHPAVGTPMMLAAPSLALDLPFRVRLREDEAGRVWLTYNAPAYLARRHALPPASAAKLEGLVAFLQEAAA